MATLAQWIEGARPRTLPAAVAPVLVGTAAAHALGPANELGGPQLGRAGEDEKVVIKGFFTGEGLAWFTTTLGENYLGFPPLVTIGTKGDGELLTLKELLKDCP